MRQLMVVILVAVLCCGITAGQAGANEIPKALAGVDLASAQCITDSEATNVRGLYTPPNSKSPNGFSVGYCTWYVDWRAYQQLNWKLKFSVSSGRDAWRWWDIVTNAGRGQEGHVNDIMVFGAWTGNPYGHVAWVENMITKGSKWQVEHANWRGFNIISKETFQRVNSSSVQLSGGKQTYPLRGFLYKK
jgi:surface antigen